MPIDRFYADADLSVGTIVHLDETQSHHLAHVMRLSIGDQVELVNGRGLLAQGKVTDFRKKSSVIQLTESVKQSRLIPMLSLAIPFMRQSKLEWIVEKGTELGVDTFIFYQAMNSEKNTISAHQQERLRNLSIAALKQSGRLYLPSFEIASNFFCHAQPETVILFGDLEAKKMISLEQLKEVPSILFITGPEKGFTEEEMIFLKKQAQGFRLNAYTLRAETAPIVAASILAQLQ